MSKLVCHFGKYNRGNVFGLQKHNQRENKNYSNENIDLEKSKLNYDLHNEYKINYLKKLDNTISKYRTNSQKSVRKDAIVYVETLVSSDKEFFKGLSETEKRRFFVESYKYLQDKVGSNNVIASTVHMDEATPHMHFCFVPINSDGSLSAKKMINRNFLREIQDEFPKHLKNKGFNIERGIENTEIKKRHLEPLEFKKAKLKQEEYELDEKEKYNKERAESILKLSEGLNKADNDLLETINTIKNIKAEKGLFGDYIKISEKDYNSLIDLATEGQKKVIENLTLKTDLKKSNNKVKSLESSLQSIQKENAINRAERARITDLEERNSTLKRNCIDISNKYDKLSKAIDKLGFKNAVKQELSKEKGISKINKGRSL